MPNLKNYISVNSRLFAVVLTLPYFHFVQSPSFAQPKDNADSFAVVELFTSEGCSSCPPADKVLSGLIKEARDKGLNIYGLSFHVDYWDYIGWKDPYSNKKYSERQFQYSRAFKNNRKYTPQMIVNGQKEFVGSNQSEAENSVQDALAKTASVKIILQSKLADNQLQLDYSVAGLAKNTIINIALVESDLVQDVSRGENRGRLLKHDNVVRDFQVFQRTKGKAVFDLSDVESSNAGVIVYVQDAASMKILGARRIYLSEVQ